MKRILGVLIILVLVVGVGSLATSVVRTPANNHSVSPSLRSVLGPSSSGGVSQADLPKAGEMIVRQAERSDTSAPLRSIPASPPRQAPSRPEKEFPHLNKANASAPPEQRIDTAIQKVMGPLVMPTPIQNFDGMY